MLFGIDFSVAAGQVASLIGRNGMGKTTTVKSVIGLIKPTGGSARFLGNNLTGEQQMLAIARAQSFTSHPAILH